MKPSCAPNRLASLAVAPDYVGAETITVTPIERRATFYAAGDAVRSAHNGGADG